VDQPEVIGAEIAKKITLLSLCSIFGICNLLYTCNVQQYLVLVLHQQHNVSHILMCFFQPSCGQLYHASRDQLLVQCANISEKQHWSLEKLKKSEDPEISLSPLEVFIHRPHSKLLPDSNGTRLMRDNHPSV
jgi:hypothetical protein